MGKNEPQICEKYSKNVVKNVVKNVAKNVAKNKQVYLIK